MDKTGERLLLEAVGLAALQVEVEAAALDCARGAFQRALILRKARVSGIDRHGKARDHWPEYMRSTARLVERLGGAGVAIVDDLLCVGPLAELGAPTDRDDRLAHALGLPFGVPSDWRHALRWLVYRERWSLITSDDARRDVIARWPHLNGRGLAPHAKAFGRELRKAFGYRTAIRRLGLASVRVKVRRWPVA